MSMIWVDEATVVVPKSSEVASVLHTLHTKVEAQLHGYRIVQHWKLMQNSR